MFLRFNNKHGFLILEVLVSVVVFMIMMIVAVQSLSNSFFLSHRLNQKSYLILKAFALSSERYGFTKVVTSSSEMYSYVVEQGEGQIETALKPLKYDYMDVALTDNLRDRVRIYFPQEVEDENK